MSEQGFDFSRFVQDSKNTLTNPKAYFSAMPVQGGFVEPLIKAIIYGTLAGVFKLIWSLLHLSGLSSGFALFGGAVGIMALIGSIIGAIIGLFIGGVIILILSAICGGSTDYEGNVRVAASLMVLSVVNAFLGFFAGINLTLGIIVGLLVNLYGLWMLYHALNEALKAKPNSSKVLTIILAVVLVLFMLLGMGTRKALKNYGSNLEDITSKYEKMADDMTKDAEKALSKSSKELNKTMNEMMGEAESESAFTLEMSSGDLLENPSARDIKKQLSTLGEDNDFAILSLGDDYVQAAVSDDGYYLEYSDESGQYGSTTPGIDMETVVKIFQLFLKKDSDWKQLVEWDEL